MVPSASSMHFVEALKPPHLQKLFPHIVAHLAFVPQGVVLIQVFQTRHVAPVPADGNITFLHGQSSGALFARS